jgi:hypothetical protein
MRMCSKLLPAVRHDQHCGGSDACTRTEGTRTEGTTVHSVCSPSYAKSPMCHLDKFPWHSCICASQTSFWLLRRIVARIAALVSCEDRPISLRVKCTTMRARQCHLQFNRVHSKPGEVLMCCLMQSSVARQQLPAVLSHYTRHCHQRDHNVCYVFDDGHVAPNRNQAASARW